ncbi:MAG: glycosyltransferase [Actinobacteria bacterium]|nr:glycosyltransferase [Actinomycetota bacterium]
MEILPGLSDYKEIVGKKYIEQLYHLASFTKGKKVIMVNSTRTGGGVAEILHRLIPLINELGIECHWKIINGDNGFFKITKNIHNALQGNRICFSREELEYYLEINRKNSKDIDLDADIVVIHDPQPLPIINFYNSQNAKWVWRCHIDLSKPDLALWKHLRNYINQYDASIFSISKFSRKLPHRQFLILPSIDPLSDKNKDLSQEKISEVLESFNIKNDRPIILQVSRFDRFKDPAGVIEAYRLVKKEINCQLILAGGVASDDPEGLEVLEEVRTAAGSDPDIHILLLEPDSNIEINALQRAADVVIQKSLKEGFGLVVSEALWKEKPVVGGAVGGITTQIKNYHNGFLVYSIEGAAYRIRYLLNRPHMAKIMGRHAKMFAHENFLITRHLRDYLSLFIILYSGNKNIIHA